MVTRMIAIGEKSGQLEKMLSKVAEFYDEQVDTAVEGLTKLIEPLIIGFLGIVVGFIVVALFLPILNMTSGDEVTRCNAGVILSRQGEGS